MPPEDRASGPGGWTSPDATPSDFSGGADSECIFCRKTGERGTAEMLYMSQEWDYYYCYRCRRWFKRYYENERVVLAVRDPNEIRHLTWAYVFRMERLHRQAEFKHSLEHAWGVLGRRLLHQ